MKSGLLFLALVYAVRCQREPSEIWNPDCPAAHLMAPCSCIHDNPTQSTAVRCEGYNVTFESLQTAIGNLKRASNIGSSMRLVLANFYLQTTGVEILYSNIFDQMRIGLFNISNNRNLHAIMPRSLNANPLLRLRARTVVAHNCAFYRPNLEDFGLFGDYTQSLSLTGNRYTSLVAPGSISALVDLERLDLSYNKILYIEGSFFKYNGRLNRIDISHNRVNELRGPTYEILPDYRMLDTVLTIDLSNNDLTDESIRDASEFRSTRRSTDLLLGNNNFMDISKEHFLGFIMDRKGNDIDFTGNKIICDDQTAWLKRYAPKGSELSWLKGADCANEPGRTVFTSKSSIVKSKFSSFFAAFSAVMLALPTLIV